MSPTSSLLLSPTTSHASLTSAALAIWTLTKRPQLSYPMCQLHCLSFTCPLKPCSHQIWGNICAKWLYTQHAGTINVDLWPWTCVKGIDSLTPLHPHHLIQCVILPCCFIRLCTSQETVCRDSKVSVQERAARVNLDHLFECHLQMQENQGYI